MYFFVKMNVKLLHMYFSCAQKWCIYGMIKAYIYIHYAKHIRFGETPLKNKNHVINIILYAKNIFSTV